MVLRQEGAWNVSEESQLTLLSALLLLHPLTEKRPVRLPHEKFLIYIY